MPIKKATAFTASDGSLCATLEEAQRHELALVWLQQSPITGEATEAQKDHERKQAVDFAHLVQSNADAILDILTTGPRSRPSTRKQKGTANPKRAAKQATPATTTQVKQGLQEAREAVEAA